MRVETNLSEERRGKEKRLSKGGVEDDALLSTLYVYTKRHHTSRVYSNNERKKQSTAIFVHTHTITQIHTDTVSHTSK